MAKTFRAEGKSIQIAGQGTGITSGSIFRRSNPITGGYWTGIVTDDIIGTTEDLTTVDGRPILIGDGVAAEAQTGDGKGDMMVEGVFALLVNALSAVISGSMPVYAHVASFADPGASLVVSGVTRNADFVVSGALVGFAVDDEYTTGAAPFAGRRLVDVKLLGLPLHDIANLAP